MTPEHRLAELHSLSYDEREGTPQRRIDLIRSWAERDPSEAALWVERVSASEFYADALRHVSITWANRDIDETLRWLHRQPEGEPRTAALVSVGYEAARSSPPTAVSLAAGLAPSADRDRLLSHAISQWATTDPNATLSYLQELRDTSLRQDLLAGFAVSVADLDASVAASVAATELMPGDQQDRVAVEIVQRWAQQSLDEASDWVDAFPHAAARTAALEQLTLLSDLWGARVDAAPLADAPETNDSLPTAPPDS